MTITSTTARNDYTGTGSAGPFAYTFKIFDPSQLAVSTTDLFGYEHLLSYPADFAVTGVNARNGGTISLTSPLPSGWDLAIERVVPLLQLTNLRDQGSFFPETYEDALDYLTMIAQQIGEPEAFAVQVPQSPANIDPVIGSFDAGYYIRVRLDGLGLEGVTNVTADPGFLQSGTGAIERTANAKMGEVLSVKDFGALGDGFTNDTVAFQRLAAAVNAAGGGAVLIPPGTYIVGKQTFAGATGKGYAYQAQDILHFMNCTTRVTVYGAGAILRAAAGLKFGSFDPTTGAAYFPGSLPFTNQDYRADVYEGMIRFDACTGGATVHGLELDGNMANITLGGQFGDTGYQCWGTGIHSNETRGGVVLIGCHPHHHSQDGFYVQFETLVETDAATPHTLIDCLSEYNGRQGLSWVGGRGLTAINCAFNHTGRGTFLSAPAAGVDFEPDSINRDGTFLGCRFVNNVGVGAVADSGDTQDVHFARCLFWGTTQYACWPRKPGFSFDDCVFYGSTLASGSGQLAKPNKFRNCYFEDAPYVGGVVYRATYLLDFGGGNGPQGVTLEDCTIVANGLRSMFASQSGGSAATRCHLIRCQFTHKYSGDADLSPAAALHDTYLVQCHFMESISPAPATGYYIDTSSNVLVGDGGVTVDGPAVKWLSPTSGTTGVIGNSQSWTAMTGTATKGGGFATGSVTLPQLAQVVKALLDAELARVSVSA